MSHPRTWAPAAHPLGGAPRLPARAGIFATPALWVSSGRFYFGRRSTTQWGWPAFPWTPLGFPLRWVAVSGSFPPCWHGVFPPSSVLPQTFKRKKGSDATATAHAAAAAAAPATARQRHGERAGGDRCVRRARNTQRISKLKRFHRTPVTGSVCGEKPEALHYPRLRVIPKHEESSMRKTSTQTSMCHI